MDQQYCLRWHNHPSNLTGVLISLLQREALCDVTLAVEGETIKAHQTILSACSPYFESIFIQNSHPHPIMYLKDVGYEELKAIIEYMYKGEVNVAQRSLPKFLKTAEGLQVKGLTESNNMNYRPNNEDRNSVETPPITTGNSINNNRSNYLNRERSNSERGHERSGSIIGDRTSSDKDPDDYRDINDHGKDLELSATIESRKRRKNSSSCDNLMTSLPERHFSDSQASSHSSYKLSPLPKPITMDEDVDGIGRRKSPASNQMAGMQQQHQISIKQETISDVSGTSIHPSLNLNHNLLPLDSSLTLKQQLQTQLPPPLLPTTLSNTNQAQLTALNHNFNYSQNQQSSPGGSFASVNPNKRTAPCFSDKEELDNLLRHTQMLYNSMNQRSLYEQKNNRRQDGIVRSSSPGPRQARNNFPGAFSINLGSMASTSGSGTTTTRKTGRFRPNWLEQFNWLQYDDVNNIMFCLFCRRWSNDIPDIRTSFVEGNSNFRLEIVNHHEKCKAHKMCREREQKSKDDEALNVEEANSKIPVSNPLNPEEMSNLFAAQHALQSNESSENEQQLSQIDHPDNVDGAEGQFNYHQRIPPISPPIVGNGGLVNIIASGVNNIGNDRMSCGARERIRGSIDYERNRGAANTSPAQMHHNQLHHHQMSYHNMFTPSRDPGTLWRCRSCGKEVTNRWHHFHSHTAQRSMCPLCPATYSRIDTLRSHLKVKHKDHYNKQI
ncbi:unnamed protein product [Diamesa serratosioi]